MNDGASHSHAIHPPTAWWTAPSHHRCHSGRHHSWSHPGHPLHPRPPCAQPGGQSPPPDSMGGDMGPTISMGSDMGNDMGPTISMGGSMRRQRARAATQQHSNKAHAATQARSICSTHSQSYLKHTAHILTSNIMAVNGTISEPQRYHSSDTMSDLDVLQVDGKLRVMEGKVSLVPVVVPVTAVAVRLHAHSARLGAGTAQHSTAGG